MPRSPGICWLSLASMMICAACGDSSACPDGEARNEDGICARVDGMGGAGGGGTGGSLGSPCTDNRTCVVAPEGWQGPVALVESATGCGGAFPDSIVGPLQDGLQPGTASCECDCTRSERTVSCPERVSILGYELTGCQLDPAGGIGLLPEGSCFDRSRTTGSLKVVLPFPTSSCADGTVLTDIPEPSWSRSIVACGRLTGFDSGAGQCEPGQACVPVPAAPFDQGLCYLREGEHPCPTGFPNRTVFYESLTDTRECPATCSCQSSGASCEVTVRRYTDTGCGMSIPNANITVSSGPEGRCSVVNTLTNSIFVGPALISDRGSCAPGSAVVSGSVEGTGATTVCCD